eukprot:GILK01000751.1.p1 GENE.GILK01000751.1~~GILK01000751.1.p1  ORF type:complete len:637 (+),score=106.16 GILK01000751.1:110-2020(+)
MSTSGYTPKSPCGYPAVSVYPHPTRDNFKRVSTLKYKNGNPVALSADELADMHITSPSHALSSPQHQQQQPTMADSLRLMSSSKPYSPTGTGFRPKGSDGSLTNPPAWLKHDRQVLRFYAFFNEPVVESPYENFRVRKCVLHYYLEDGTLHISEPRQENSGIPQGQFLKRHRVPKAERENEFYGEADLMVGGELTMYGRTYKIVDCDPFTRTYYETDLGIQQPSAEDYPSDVHTTMLETGKMRAVTKKQDDFRQYIEARLRGGAHPGMGLKQFLDFDRVVLRFYCSWDSTEATETRPFILHYFKADDTLEIRELRNNNTGRDPFPMMLRRQKLPKSFADPAHARAHYTDADLDIGVFINVFERNFLIYDADAATRRFYEEHHGRTLQPSLAREKPQVGLPRMEPPPHNGYGTEEDSLQNFYHLVPKPPKKDIIKMLAQAGFILRYSATLVTDKPEDKHRKFVVAYNLAEDTLSIFEPPQRNSGTVGGKFLERCRVKNPRTNEYYTKNDITTGGTMEVFSHVFLIGESDEYTRKYIESGGAAKPHLNANLVEENIKDKIRFQSTKFRDMFRKLDVDHNRLIDADELKHALEAWGLQLSDQEIFSLINKYDVDSDGKIDYHEFCLMFLPDEMHYLLRK